jgi:hypothetical protein
MHNAAEWPGGEHAAAVQEAHLAMAGIDHSGHEERRITADKFRSLKARLSTGTASANGSPAPAPAIHIPDLLLKVRSARQANVVDIWADLETKLPAQPLAIEEAKPETPLPQPEQNGFIALPELPPFEASAAIEAKPTAPPSIINLPVVEEPIAVEAIAETSPAELAPIEYPVAELPSEATAAETEEQPQPIEAMPEASTEVLTEPVEANASAKSETAPVAEEPSEPKALQDALAERLGPHVSILRKPAAQDNAFDENLLPQASTPVLPSESSEPQAVPPAAGIDLEAKDAVASVLPDPETAIDVNPDVDPADQVTETDPQAGEMARSLLDIMSAPSGATQPQERALAADMLLRLVPRIPLRPMIALVDRICVMEPPPPLLVARLIKDKRPDIAGPILERCNYIADQDLMEVIGEGNPAKQRMIARRRHISAALSDALVATADPSVLLTLVRNPGATISHDAFYRLCLHAKDHPSLQAPLTTRTDTPAPVAFELFWLLPVELRRYVLSRFLTDSETLNKLLKMASAVDAAESGEEASELKFPEKKKVDRLVDLIEKNEASEAVALMEEIANVHEFTARRILADADGEPLTVVFKAIGMTRAQFAEAITGIIASPVTKLRQDRNASDLQNIFDSLSFNKARVLLTYWDWASDETGNTAQL